MSRPRSVATSAQPSGPVRGERLDAEWRDRSGRLFEAFERPARAMIRRAFRGAFSDEELDDIYAGAWAGTLRSLAQRHRSLTDDEIRSYVLTAVANHASKELRRRRRKPTASLELVGGVADDGDSPAERATAAEESRITRDLLASLPPRRRAVIMLRYGWGLEPSQVCRLVEGLSARAYRKEITKGIDELTERMKVLERGEWCVEREPVLKAYAAGVADGEQSLQAQAHIAHCRSCADFVARLSGHLHDLGGAVAATGAIDALDGSLSIADQLASLGERGRDALAGIGSRGGEAVTEAAGPLTTSGAARGAGVAGAGLAAKIAGLGTAGKVAVACLGGGAAATACIAAGVAPVGLPGGGPERSEPVARERAERPRDRTGVVATPAPATETLPAEQGEIQVPPVAATPSPAAEPAGTGASGSDDGGSEDGESTVEAEPASPVAPSAPPVEQEFGVAAAAAPAPAPSTSSESSTTSSAAPTSAGGDGSASAVRQEFGP